MFISFCVVNYNNVKYIAECLDSILSQTDNDYEILIVDDGSKDGSGEICDKYSKNYHQVKVIHQEWQGVSIARNTAIDNAKGEWIFFVDGDDIVSPYAVESLKKLKIDCYNTIQFGYKSFVDGQKYRNWSADLCRSVSVDNVDLLSKAIYSLNHEESNAYRYATVWGKIFKRKFLSEHGIIFIPGVIFSQDMIFCLSVFDIPGTSIENPVVLYGYRLNNYAIASRYSPNLHNDVKFVKDCFLGEVLRLKSRERISMYNKRVALRLFAFIHKVLLCDIFHPDNDKSEDEKKTDFEELVNNYDIKSLNIISKDDIDTEDYFLLMQIKNQSYRGIKIYVRTKKLLQRLKKLLLTSRR